MNTVASIFNQCFVFVAGKFGAYMKVGVEIDGPVTLLLDSRRPDAANSEAAAGGDDT